MPHEWYVDRQGVAAGPYTASTLKAMIARGEVARNEIIRGGPNGRAMLAAQLLEIGPVAAVKPMPPLPPPPNANPASATGSAGTSQAGSVPPPLPVKRPPTVRSGKRGQQTDINAAAPSEKTGNAFSFASLALAVTALVLLLTPPFRFVGSPIIAFIMGLAGLILAMTGTGYSSLRKGDFFYAAVGLVLNGIGAVVAMLALGWPANLVATRASASGEDVSRLANRPDASADAAALVLPETRAFAEPGAAMIASEGLVWTLEGKALKEAQMILASDDARDLRKPSDGSGDLKQRESALRSLLCARRSESTLATGRAFLECCNRQSRQWIADTSSTLRMRPEDFVIEWLTYEGALDFGIMTHIWNQQGSFKGEAAKIVESFLDGVSEPPSAEKGVELQSLDQARVAVNLFGMKVVEELIPDKPVKTAGDRATVWWKSNYDYLRRILKGNPAKPMIEELLQRENNRYRVDYVEWFKDYFDGGHRQPWVSRMIDSSALGVASSVRDQRVLQNLGTSSSSSFARKPLQELFTALSPSTPVVEAVGKGTGSGCLVESDGKDLVITNRHVVENASDGVAIHFITSLRDGEETRFTVPPRQTTVVAIHKTADLALVDVSPAAADIRKLGIKPLELAMAAHRPQVGEHVFAIGHPGAGASGRLLTRSLSDGIVSADGREYENARFLQVTVPLNPGNSGGPLFDDEGRVVGINTFIIRKNQAADLALEGLNFALEINYVHELLDDKSKSLDESAITSVLKPRQPDRKLAGAILQELKTKADLAQSKGFRWYGSSYETATKVVDLPARRMYSLTLDCVQGETYLVFGISRGAPDIDLTVAASSGTIVAADTKDDAEPVVSFTARTSGKYVIVASNPSTSDAVALIAAFER